MPSDTHTVQHDNHRDNTTEYNSNNIEISTKEIGIIVCAFDLIFNQHRLHNYDGVNSVEELKTKPYIPYTFLLLAVFFLFLTLFFYFQSFGILCIPSSWHMCVISTIFIKFELWVCVCLRDMCPWVRCFSGTASIPSLAQMYPTKIGSAYRIAFMTNFIFSSSLCVPVAIIFDDFRIRARFCAGLA